MSAYLSTKMSSVSLISPVIKIRSMENFVQTFVHVLVQSVVHVLVPPTVVWVTKNNDNSNLWAAETRLEIRSRGVWVTREPLLHRWREKLRGKRSRVGQVGARSAPHHPDIVGDTYTLAVIILGMETMQPPFDIPGDILPILA